jgi:small subunit ribosomal protein S3
MRPGMVIGRAGTGVKELERRLSEKFGIRNLTVAVAGIEIPELNPYVMASRVARALERGIHFRRAGFWALNTIMNAGALGAEVIISGKLRTERATYEKYRAGYLAKAGKPAEGVGEATVDVRLKPGVYGIKVRIMPPTAPIVDRPALRSAEFLKERLAEESERGEKE